MSEEPLERSRRRRWPWIVAFTMLLLLALFYAGGGFYFSNVLDERALDAASMREAAAELEPNVQVVTVSSDPGSTQATITLRLLEDDLAE